MIILKTSGWEDYELLDSGEGYRLERFGKYVLSRPDPQAIWKKQISENTWKQADAYFNRTEKDKGTWIKNNQQMPDRWLMSYKQLSFWVKLSPFKHTGVFPEQKVHWDFITESIADIKQKYDSPIKILNLFAYTGIASIISAYSQAQVTHVDASKPSLTWARENQEASGLIQKPIRWILDDALKFTQREVKRGNKYDAIIMDPPVFGHGPDGKAWKFHEHFPRLLELCREVLSQNPFFVIVNAYAISSSALMLENVFNDYFADLNGTITSGELALEEKENKRLLSTGLFTKWSKKVMI